MCNCKSYNLGGGTMETVPVEIQVGIEIGDKAVRKTVNVDACIADVVKAVNDAGYPTISSCCGHNRDRPSIIFSEVLTDEMICEAAKFISTIDSRDFELTTWRLINPRMVYQSKYPLWGRVILEGDISAVITAVRFSASTMYCVEWFSQGNKRSEWMLEREMDEFTK